MTAPINLTQLRVEAHGIAADEILHPWGEALLALIDTAEAALEINELHYLWATLPEDHPRNRLVHTLARYTTDESPP